MSSEQMFFVILVFETLSEQLLHEYSCLGKVPGAPWRPWETTFSMGMDPRPQVTLASAYEASAPSGVQCARKKPEKKDKKRM